MTIANERAKVLDHSSAPGGAMTDEIDYTNPDYIPPKQAYIQFLSSGEATAFERDILLAHYAAPRQDARNAAIAEALSSTLLIVNGAYGRLGRKVMERLSIAMPEGALPSHALSWFESREDGYYYSVMHNRVREAIEQIGWAEEAQTRYEKFWSAYLRRVPQDSYWGGREREQRLISRARNGRARQECIEHYKARCFACRFDFGAAYGEHGEGFIEVHHLEPMSDRPAGRYQIDPIRDLRPVCSNCHRMLHWKGLTRIEDLKALIDDLRKRKPTT